MLDIKNLHAAVDGKEILKGLNLSINPGEMHAIMGRNGSGKSTLIKNIFYPALIKALGGYGPKTGQFDRLIGSIKNISAVK